jgi:hypothetical protein
MITEMTDALAADAIRAHHSQMAAELRLRVDRLRAAVAAAADYADAHADVQQYLDRDVLPHAAAEEAALYPAGDAGSTALLVRAMRTEHVVLTRHVDTLRRAAGGIDAVASASSILALFESHLAKENDLLVPALVADPEVSLSSLLDGMHELLG